MPVLLINPTSWVTAHATLHLTPQVVSVNVQVSTSTWMVNVNANRENILSAQLHVKVAHLCAAVVLMLVLVDARATVL